MFVGEVMIVGLLQTLRGWPNTSRFGVAVPLVGERMLIAG